MKTSTRICKPSTKVFLFFSCRIYFLNIRKQEIKVLVVAFEIVSDVFAKVCRNILINVFIHVFIYFYEIRAKTAILDLYQPTPDGKFTLKLVLRYINIQFFKIENTYEVLCLR